MQYLLGDVDVHVLDGTNYIKYSDTIARRMFPPEQWGPLFDKWQMYVHS